jgi:excisionase family DNA binding protein
MAIDSTQADRSLFTVEECAVALRVTRKTVYRMIGDGRLRALRLGDAPTSPLRISAGSLAAFIERRRQVGTQLKRH